MVRAREKKIEAVNDDSVKTKATMMMTTAAQKATFPSSLARFDDDYDDIDANE